MRKRGGPPNNTNAILTGKNDTADSITEAIDAVAREFKLL